MKNYTSTVSSDQTINRIERALKPSVREKKGDAMEENKKIKCVYCGRRKSFSEEGRVIDGSWPLDKELPNKYWGTWVCSFPCYQSLTDREVGR